MTDFLPAPFFLEGPLTPVSSPPTAANEFWVNYVGVGVNIPAVSLSTTNNSVTRDFTTLPDSNNLGGTIEIYYRVKATHLPFADGLYLTNQGVAQHQDTHTHEIFAANIVQVFTREPDLHITKGVVATDDDPDSILDPGHGVFTPTLPSSSYSDPGTTNPMFRYPEGGVIHSGSPNSFVPLGERRVWVTADALQLNPDAIYGLQGLPSSGGRASSPVTRTCSTTPRSSKSPERSQSVHNSRT